MDNMKVKTSKYIKLVSYNDLLLWDVKRYLIEEIKSNFDIIPLEEVLVERSEKHKLFNFPNKEFGILGVNNKIGLFDAYTEVGNKINQSYKKMYVGDLAYNPYRINVGSIGLKDESHSNDYISPAYVVFSCKENLLPDFLYKIFKTETFSKIIRENTTGSVRQNLKFDTLSEIKIPLPKIAEQRKLLDDFYSKINLANSQEKEVEIIHQKIEDYIYQILGIKKIVETPSNNKLKFAEFRIISRWSVDYISKNKHISNILQGEYDTKRLGDFIISHQYGLSSKSTDKPTGTPMLRMNNIYDSEVVLDDIKYIQIEDHLLEKNILKKGDLLFNRTNSKELVGKTAIFNEDGEYTFASYLIRVKLDTSKVNIEYINYLFNSPILQFQKDMISRKILGQANINAQEMQDFLFPIPPLPVQDEIVSEIKNMKEKIKTLKQEAELNRKLAIQEFETKIFN